jgi:LysM repeat protein
MTKFEASEWLNTICGEYRLNILLGQGRAGGVFIAENIKTKDLAAVKIYAPGRYAEAAKSIARERERLNHPSIVAQLGSGSLGGGFFYTIQEYAAYKAVGGCNDSDCLNLEEYLNKTPGLLEEDVVADLLTQLTDALSYAHSAANLPYGGINPHGIMITESSGSLSGRPLLKLTDVGLPAVRTPNDPDDAYVSQEEIQGFATEQSDIFAMGAIAHLMLTGAPPHGQVASFSALRADVAPGWEALILKSLSYSLEERYESYQEFLRAITHVDDIPPVVREESSKNIWFYLSCLICVLLVLGFAFRDQLRDRFPVLEKIFPSGVIKPLPKADDGVKTPQPAETAKTEKAADKQKEGTPENKVAQNALSDPGSITIIDEPEKTPENKENSQELLTASGTSLTGAENKAAGELAKAAEEAKEKLEQKAAETQAAVKGEAEKAAQAVKDNAEAVADKAKEDLKKAEEEAARQKAEAEKAAKAAAEEAAKKRAEAEKAAKEAAEQAAKKASDKAKELAQKVDEAVLGTQGEVPDTYTVKKGDSLWTIARNFKLKVSDLQEWNGLSDSNIREGTVLKLKAPAKEAPAETKGGEAEKKGEGGSYTVQPGDTYYSLAKKFSTSSEKLLELNENKELKAGDTIKVHDGE